MTSADPIVELVGLHKRFGGVHALRGASLQLCSGTVTALVGDNGAGKSTLVKTMTGVVKPDSGEIRVRGDVVSFRGPTDAATAGIAAVYQDLALCPNLDATSNLFLGHERVKRRHRGPWAIIDRARSESEARRHLADLHISIPDFSVPVETLSGGQKQSVAIARSLVNDPVVVILDEPTAALSVTATEEVLRLVRKLRDTGHAVLVVSHNLSDVFSVADEITVLRLGSVAGVFRAADATRQEILAAMVGSTDRGLVRNG